MIRFGWCSIWVNGWGMTKRIQAHAMHDYKILISPLALIGPLQIILHQNVIKWF